MPVSLLALAAGAFGIGTTEFIIMGLLTQVSQDLHTSIPTAGTLISGYAFGVAGQKGEAGQKSASMELLNRNKDEVERIYRIFLDSGEASKAPPTKYTAQDALGRLSVAKC